MGAERSVSASPVRVTSPRQSRQNPTGGVVAWTRGRLTYHTRPSAFADFSEFLKVIASQKTKTAQMDDESDTVDAFIALGGNPDKTGEISCDKLRATIKEFGLTIDIDRLIRETDTDHSGLIDYFEFRQMMADKR